jgi:hypothetical protein
LFKSWELSLEMKDLRWGGACLLETRFSKRPFRKF